MSESKGMDEEKWTIGGGSSNVIPQPSIEEAFSIWLESCPLGDLGKLTEGSSISNGFTGA